MCLRREDLMALAALFVIGTLVNLKFKSAHATLLKVNGERSRIHQNAKLNLAN